MPLLHVTGPQCSGKTYVIRKAIDTFGERVKSWDIWDFYGKHQIIDDQGRMNWDRWRKHEGRIAPDLLKFVKENTRSTDLLIVESSGIAKNINGVLRRLTGQQQMRIALEHCDPEELPSRVQERRLDIERVKNFNQIYRGKIPADTTYVSQKDLLTGIQELMHQMLRGGWCEICGAPRAHPRDLCCLPHELGWDE